MKRSLARGWFRTKTMPPRKTVTALASAFLLACSPAAVPVEPTSPAASRVPSPSTSASAARGTNQPTANATPTLGENEFVNPVIDADFPDPDVILVGDSYYAYATARGSTNIQLARSENLVDWKMLPDALPDLAAWSGLTTAFTGAPQRATWAPDIAEVDDAFILYYTAPALKAAKFQGEAPQCIGRATSARPEGPFRDTSSAPLVCQPELGFTIDPAYFEDADGNRYLLWRGGCCGLASRIYIQKLTDDGLGVTGEIVDTGIRNDRPWEGGTAEAPTLLFRDGTYYLLYSGNNPFGYDYGVGYATSDSVLGPYEKAEENPILVTKAKVVGPGHQSIIEDKDGDLWLTYHAWERPKVGYEAGGRRAMLIDELVVDDGTVRVLGPDTEPQAAP
jgi:beta-xylosidase